MFLNKEIRIFPDCQFVAPVNDNRRLVIFARGQEMQNCIFQPTFPLFKEAFLRVCVTYGSDTMPHPFQNLLQSIVLKDATIIGV